MSVDQSVIARSGNVCELSGATENLTIYSVKPQTTATEDNTVYISDTCVAQIEKKEPADASFWQGFLGESMWSEVPGIKILSWRMLNRFKSESWASELLDMMYLDDEELAWAQALGEEDNEVEEAVVHKDCNGNILQNGDTVNLIKTLDVKGSSISAKIGTAVRNIRLVEGNAEQIEGKVEGQLIVILTKYVKKQA